MSTAPEAQWDSPTASKAPTNAKLVAALLDAVHGRVTSRHEIYAELLQCRLILGAPSTDGGSGRQIVMREGMQTKFLTMQNEKKQVALPIFTNLHHLKTATKGARIDYIVMSGVALFKELGGRFDTAILNPGDTSNIKLAQWEMIALGRKAIPEAPGIRSNHLAAGLQVAMSPPTDIIPQPMIDAVRKQGGTDERVLELYIFELKSPAPGSKPELSIGARLKPGIDQSEAQQVLQAIARGVQSAVAPGVDIHLLSLNDEMHQKLGALMLPTFSR